jgi:hypothetical protein
MVKTTAEMYTLGKTADGMLYGATVTHIMGVQKNSIAPRVTHTRSTRARSKKMHDNPNATRKMQS